MLESISLLGSSSGRNAGDAALIAGIMRSVDNACGQRLMWEIPTLRPEFIWRSYENRVRAISMLPWAGTVGMLGIPTYQSLMRTNMTLIYDAMIMGDTMSGGSLPTARWASVAMPTLVMDGGRSPTWARHAVQALVSLLPNARRHTLEGQEHNVSPEALAPVLEVFLNE